MAYIELIIKMVLNYKNRGRRFYLLELVRPVVWRFIKNKHRGKKQIWIERNGIKWNLPLSDVNNLVSGTLFVHGRFNQTEVDRFMMLARENPELGRLVDRKTVMIDIGANHGTASICFARSGMFTTIHAVEPDPDNYGILCENIRANKLQDIIKCHNYALSDRAGYLDFELSVMNSGDHRIVPDTLDPGLNLYEEDKRNKIKVPCVTLDEFITGNCSDVSEIGLIWTDTQGHEGHILAGSRILKDHPVPIITEIWPYGLARSRGMALFLDFVKKRYSHFTELESGSPAPMPIDGIDGIVGKLGYKGRSTDVLLFPRAGGSGETQTGMAQKKIREVNCPLCQSSDRRGKYRFPESGLGIVQCVNCGLVYTSPRLDDEVMKADVYDGGYFFGEASRRHGGDFAERETIFRQKWASDLLPLIENRLGGKGRLLDVGCATGILVDEANRRGWDAYGIDISESAVTYARAQFGIDARTGTLNDELFPDGFFDAVTMMSVLEHVPDPLGALERAFRLLRPGGLIVIESPNIECRQSRRAGGAWFLLGPEEHLVHFSNETLSRMVIAAGFDAESIGGEGGSGLLNRLDRPGFRRIRTIVLRHIHYLNWLRRLVKRVHHAAFGANNIMTIARKPDRVSDGR